MTGNAKTAPPHETQGVQELIDRLRHDGVEEGRARAQQIVEEAERRAAWTLAQAEEEAERVRAEARAESERLREAASQAIRAAGRDAVLDLKAELTARFSARVEHLVGRETGDTALLRDLILAVASRVRDDQRLDTAGQLKVLLPRESVEFGQLRREQERAGDDELSGLVLDLSAADLREGVEIAVGSHGRGIRLQLVESQVTIDLTDEAVADLLLEHLLPRFRALLEGIVR